MGRLFGTDGVRGVANMEPMTAETALLIGRATAHVCKRHKNRHRVVIGKDTRVSGYMIENALTAGICSMGVDVLLVGPMPTPGIAFITHSADIRQILDHIGVDSELPHISPARGPPLWDDCGDAQMGESVEVEPGWDMTAQPAPDYEVDQRINW